MCPRRHTSSLMSMACDAIPIVVRATTLTRVPPSTARIAQHNARATGHPVFIVGCWPATTTTDGVHSIGLMSHPACGEAHREARYRNRHARARLARFQPTWASVDALTHAALTGESTNSNNNNHGVGMRRMPAGRRSPQEFPPAILPNCSSSSTNNNRGCIALVVDPDVLLFKHTIKAHANTIERISTTRCFYSRRRVGASPRCRRRSTNQRRRLARPPPPRHHQLLLVASTLLLLRILRAMRLYSTLWETDTSPSSPFMPSPLYQPSQQRSLPLTIWTKAWTNRAHTHTAHQHRNAPL